MSKNFFLFTLLICSTLLNNQAVIATETETADEFFDDGAGVWPRFPKENKNFRATEKNIDVRIDNEPEAMETYVKPVSDELPAGIDIKEQRELEQQAALEKLKNQENNEQLLKEKALAEAEIEAAMTVSKQGKEEQEVQQKPKRLIDKVITFLYSCLPQQNTRELNTSKKSEVPLNFEQERENIRKQKLQEISKIDEAFAKKEQKKENEKFQAEQVQIRNDKKMAEAINKKYIAEEKARARQLHRDAQLARKMQEQDSAYF